MSTITSRLEKLLDQPSYPSIPGGSQETGFSETQARGFDSGRKNCVCDLEVRRLCIVDKIRPGSPECVKSSN